MTEGTASRCVFFFGDSLVAGVGDPHGGGWVAGVASACHAQGLALTSYNLGVRGETSTQVAARLIGEARPRMRADAEHRLVVSFGTNDTTLEGRTVRVPAEKSRGALRRILDQAGELGLAPFVVGPAAVDDMEQNRRLAELTDGFAAVCAEHGVPFLALVELLAGSSSWTTAVVDGDGAHPGGEGYDELARTILDGGLLEWLMESPSSSAIEGEQQL